MEALTPTPKPTRFTFVKLIGLQSRQDLNGTHGFCIAEDPATNRCIVRRVTGETVKVKFSNLTLASPPANPAFGSLERGSLPTRARTNALAGDALRMYELIFTGDHLDFDVSCPTNSAGAFVLEVRVLPAAGLSGTDGQLTWGVAVLPCFEYSAMLQPVAKDESYLRHVSDDDKLARALLLRVMHLFLRSLTTSEITDDMIFSIERELISQYRDLKMWVELVDFYTCAIDASLAGARNGPKVASLQPGFVGAAARCELETALAEALEACGRFEEAAALYEEAARVLIAAGGGKQVSVYLVNAGLAYKRACRWATSETLYVEAVRTAMKDKRDLQHCSSGLANLVCLYSAQMKVQKQTGKGLCWDDAIADLSRVETSLMSLLGVAEVDTTFIVSYGAATTTDLLLPAFQKKKLAVKTLFRLTQAPDVASFRDILRSCADPNKLAHSMSPCQESAEQTAKRERSLARVTAQLSDYGTERIQALKVCAECGTKWNGIPADQLKRCSRCHMVAYCSAECQRAHWKKTHKHECSQLATSRNAMSSGSIEEIIDAMLRHEESMKGEPQDP